jgi:hypothetical protein
MAGNEYTIRGDHVGRSTGVQHPGILILEVELVERGYEASLVPHRSRLGDLERREGRGRLHGREGRVSLRWHAGYTTTPRLAMDDLILKVDAAIDDLSLKSYSDKLVRMV